ncbi:hypothetical protein FA13DRAFT_1466704 [Coprinellus micaceus]|uniref:Uncharacterized protein n=1 Tax=Coprinellus micaceus TaxID=71717 RepID=A0A4Y7SLN4_COPMI|nr:hypothetical protein FA13DRAFT_1466704 [Coprinellus micaceus]
MVGAGSSGMNGSTGTSPSTRGPGPPEEISKTSSGGRTTNGLSSSRWLEGGLSTSMGTPMSSCPTSSPSTSLSAAISANCPLALPPLPLIALRTQCKCPRHLLIHLIFVSTYPSNTFSHTHSAQTFPTWSDPSSTPLHVQPLEPSIKANISSFEHVPPVKRTNPTEPTTKSTSTLVMAIAIA